jgi:hypothetical protein
MERFWGIESQWIAFQAISHIVISLPEALDAGLWDRCMKAIVTMPTRAPHVDATKLALETLAVVLAMASSPLGLTFKTEGGPKLVYQHLNLQTYRNAALMVVFAIVDNADYLGGVMDELAALASCSDLAILCEQYPPVGGNAGERAAMQDRFQKAFNRAPDWVTLDMPEEVRFVS